MLKDKIRQVAELWTHEMIRAARVARVGMVHGVTPIGEAAFEALSLDMDDAVVITGDRQLGEAAQALGLAPISDPATPA